MAYDDGNGRSMNILKKANSQPPNSRTFDARIKRVESDKMPKLLRGSPSKKKKRSFGSLFKRTGSLFNRKQLDQSSKSQKPSGLTRSQKPPGHKRAQSERPVARDSFLGRIDWTAVSSTLTYIDPNDEDTATGLFSGKKSALNSCGLYLPYKKTRNRTRLASAPILNFDKNRVLSDVDDDTEDEEENKWSGDEWLQCRMSKITDSLYLGNDNDACDEEALKAEKITHVLSMVARKWGKKRRKFDLAFPWTRNWNIKRKVVPMSDRGASQIAKLLEEKKLLHFMEDSQKRGNKLLVHCQLGQNRSPTIVMAFLMKYENLTFHQAWRKVKLKRHIVQPNVIYIKQLRDWDMYLHGKHSTPKDFLTLKVSGDGEGISVAHEHASTERMTTVMLRHVMKLKKASTLNVFSSGSTIDETETETPNSPIYLPNCPINEDEVYTTPEKQDVRESFRVDELASFGRSSKLIILSPDVSNNSEDNPSDKLILRKLDVGTNEDRMVHVAKPPRDSATHIAKLATDLNIGT